ncbi:MAG: pyridoxal phosphate-dependent aminotransferase [Gammaproteobacteria bacterium]|nr:pyridoxal phosphate-dependent aminotransferase [Gammaproteobacteria bacterium]
MQILARARELESQGRSIIHMEIGEPDFATPTPISAAGIAALTQGRTHYTPALGLPELRRAIADHYQRCYGASIAAERIVITPGASGALQLVMATLIDPGDEVLMADPGYPCNRNFVRLAEGQATLIPVDASCDYQLTAEHIERYWSSRSKAVMLASPSNPTGTVIDEQNLQAIMRCVERHGGHLIVDEIYHGLIYDDDTTSAAALTENAFILNSFSKYYGMTGWRVGWLVVPETYIPYIDKLAQNIFLAASTPAQYAALAAFSPDAQQIMAARRVDFKQRRDYLLPELRALGFDIPVTPQGAFYLYAGCQRFTNDSDAFAREILEQVGVAITPGRDFGEYQPAQHLRFAYTTSLKNLREGVRRLRNFIFGL